ncbi:MAG: alpha-amylase, partial [Ignavibacteriae bacterium]|nr:alpha-amylase [Ignavibacteriota bacterium]
MSKKIIYLFPLIFILVHNCQQKIDIKRVPQWASEAVWYQIFPERFNNGDKNNDPKPIDLAGGWPYNIPEGWQNHPWTSDWYKLQPWENNGHDFYWNAGVRRYGGDLQGVINKLDYLQNLGITAIYFNPVFESPSLHKYDASSYHHIDNNFGPDPEKDRQIWSQENPIDPTTWQWTTADKLFLELIK